jgi:putative endonuclease
VDDRGAVGTAGEETVARQYESRGFRVVARNWRCGIGELDIVVSRDDLVVVCEVKTRRAGVFGAGFDAVTRRKQAKVRAVTQAFIQTTGLVPRTIRFDVASVDVSGRRATVELFEDAF